MFNNMENCSNPFTRMTNGSMGGKQQERELKFQASSMEHKSEKGKVSSIDGIMNDPFSGSQLSLSPCSDGAAPESQQSRFYKTALEYPMRALSTDKGSFIYENMLKEVGEEGHEPDDVEDSPLFPNWNDKVSLSTFKQQGILKDSPVGKQEIDGNGPFRNQKSSANLISSIVNGSPFQNINTFGRNQNSYNGWSGISQEHLLPHPRPDYSPQSRKQNVQYTGGGGVLLVDGGSTAALLNEKDGDDGSKFKNRTRKLVTGLFLLLLMSMIPLTLAVLLVSCRSTGGVCLPQFNVQLDESSPNAADTLSSARELLKILSYIAIDMGSPAINPDDLFDDDNYSNTVDTISYENIYRLSFQGYCRDNSVSGLRFCTSCHGLDIISTLVRDVGIQLAKIVKKVDFENVGNSFVLAYKILLKNIDDKDSKSGLAKKAKLVGNISAFLAHLSIYSYGLSIFNVLYLLFLNWTITIKRPLWVFNHLRRHVLTLSLLQFLQFITVFVICAIEFEYVYQLSEVSSLSGIAIVEWDLGMYILLFDLLISGLSLLVCSVFYKVTGS